MKWLIKSGRQQRAYLCTVLEHIYLILQEIPGWQIFSSYEGHKGRKKWMEALNLNLKFKKLERHTVVVAKRRGCEILTSFLTGGM